MRLNSGAFFVSIGRVPKHIQAQFPYGYYLPLSDGASVNQSEKRSLIMPTVNPR